MSEVKMPLILTIDDEAVIRNSIKNYLEDFDYRVITAENGHIGLEKFEQERPDLVLVDLRMYELDGLDVLKHARKISPKTPVIVVSGTGVLNDAVEALRLGAQDYLLKPIEDMAVLRHTIENALERVRLQQENDAYQQNLETLVEARTAELEKTTTALQASETLYRTLVESSPDIIFMQDISGKLSYINKTVTSILGYSSEELLQSTNIFEFVHPDDRKLIFADFAKALQGQTVSVLEHRIRAKSGTYIYVSSIATPIHDPSGNISSALVIMRNITAQKNVEAEKEKLQAQLFQSQKMEALGRLTGGVAHDFNNLLTAINGYAELSILQLDTDSQSYQMVNNILQSGKRAAELVKQLLAFSRKQIATPQILDMSTSVIKLEEIFARIIGTSINIENNFCATPCLIKIDPTQFEQIVMNLIVNARDAMPDGGTLSITTEIIELDTAQNLEIDLPTGHYSVLKIADTGIGIPVEIQSQIFEPFFTTKEIGEGTGLGLSTVYGIAKQNNGDILLESHQGEGTCFNIYFPYIDGAEEIHHISDTTVSVLNYHAKILVVDDDDDVRELICTILSGEGFTTIDASDGLQALELAQENKLIDLLITDIVMPGLDGRKLAQTFRIEKPSLKILFISGYLDRQEIEGKMSNVAFLEKPFTPQQLLDTVHTMLNE